MNVPHNALRASQMNGCAFGIDMHWRDLKSIVEQDQRFYGLDAWEVSRYYAAANAQRWGGRKLYGLGRAGFLIPSMKRWENISARKWASISARKKERI